MSGAPIMVVGVPDAGVHRLAAMLGMHPRALPLPEMALCLADTVDDLLSIADMADEGVIDGLLRALADYFGSGQTDAGIASARDWLQRRGGWSTQTVLQALVERIQPRDAVMPDTQAGWRPSWLDRMVEAHPEIRIVHLVRHPRTQCTEIAAHLRRESFVPPDYKDFGATDWPRIDPQLAWFRINRNIERALQELSPGRSRKVRLEELYADVDHTLYDLLEWLNWPVSNDLIERMLHPESGRFARIGPSAAPGGGDTAFLRDPGFSGAPRRRVAMAGALPWREDISGFSREIKQLAQEFGYV